VRRLMRAQGLSGVRRGRHFKVTTTTDDTQHCPGELVNRQFVAASPNRLRVTNLTLGLTPFGRHHVVDCSGG
jgi:putative transposase